MNDIAMHNFGIKNRMLNLLNYLEIGTPAADLAQLGPDEIQRVYAAAERLKRHAAILMNAQAEYLK